MANFWNKFKTAIWEQEDVEDEEYIEDDSNYDSQTDIVTDIQTLRQRRNSNNNKYQNSSNASRHNIVIFKPEKHEDSQVICNHIRDNNPVVVNFELLDQNIAQRIMDFLSGACYSLDCNVEQVSEKILIIAPESYDISTNIKNDLKDAGLFPWVSYK